MVTEKNPRLQALREENETLHKRVKESEKNLANTNYKVLETETLQALSVKKKEEDQEMRKKLQAELEKWKDQFDETLKSNELKIERKLREAESAQIKELQADLLKEKHELIELQNKLHAIDKREAEYIIEQANRMRQKVDLEAKKKINEEQRKILMAEIHEIDPNVNDLEDRVGKLKLQVRI
jgi:chromosome segregation ATPase